MIKISRKIRIILLVVVIAVLGFVIATPLAIKSYINKNGEKLIGRKLSLNSLYYNPFTGYTRLSDFKMMEANDTAVFLSFDTLIVNMDLYKLLGRKISISAIRLTDSQIQIVKNDTTFNYSELATRLTDDESEAPQEEEQTFNIELKNIELARGVLKFQNTVTERQWLFDDIDASIPGLYFDNQNTDVDLDLTLPDGGELLSNTEYNNEMGTYKVHLELTDINLSPLQTFIKEYMKISDFGASLDAEMDISGEVGDLDKLTVAGTIDVEDYYLADPDNRRFITGDKVTTVIEQLIPMKQELSIASIDIIKPVIFYELHVDSTDNIRSLLVAQSDSSQTIETQEINIETDNIETDSVVESEFKLVISTLKVENGQLDIKDNNPESPFEYQFFDIGIDISDISPQQDTTRLKMMASAPDNGSVTLDWQGNFFDLDKQSFTVKTNLPGLPAFSPYTISFFDVPIEKGSFNYVSTNHINQGSLEGLHTIQASGITLGEKRGFESLYDVPLKVGLYLLEDKDGNIHMEIPVEGSTSDPEFRYSEVVVKAIINGIVKLVTSPVSLIGKLVGAGDSLDELTYNPVNVEITPDLEVKLNYLAEALNQKPQLRITMIQHFDSEQAKNELAVYMVKQDYYKKEHDNTSIIDYYSVNNIDFKDEGFASYLNDVSKGVATNEEELIEACYLIKEKQVQTVLDTIPDGWNNLITQYLITKGVSASNVEIQQNSDDNGKFEYELAADFMDEIEQHADSVRNTEGE